MPGEHDRRYRYLFSHPGFIERLLTSFVDEQFIADIDFSTLEQVNAHFVSDSFAERESDVIWKMSFQGSPLYLYLLLEFQSSVDHAMPLRFLRYICELYESLPDSPDKARSPRPAVFPLLLYNGERTWTASRSIEQMIEHSIPERYIPHFSYHLLAINEIPQQKLLRVHNAVSAVFYVEQGERESLERHFDEILAILAEELPECIARFSAWFSDYLGAEEFHSAEKRFESIHSLTEVKTMFAASKERFEQKLKEESKTHGLLIGKRETLERQLRRRFGEDVSDNEINAVRECSDIERLDAALDAFVTAEDPSEVISELG